MCMRLGKLEQCGAMQSSECCSQKVPLCVRGTLHVDWHGPAKCKAWATWADLPFIKKKANSAKVFPLSVCPFVMLSRIQKELLDFGRPNLMFLDLLVQG